VQDWSISAVPPAADNAGADDFLVNGFLSILVRCQFVVLRSISTNTKQSPVTTLEPNSQIEISLSRHNLPTRLSVSHRQLTHHHSSITNEMSTNTCRCRSDTRRSVSPLYHVTCCLARCDARHSAAVVYRPVGLLDDESIDVTPLHSRTVKSRLINKK